MTPPDKIVIVGISHTSVGDVTELARHAEQHGARGVLCCVPYYFANTEQGILRFLRPIDAALSEIDLILYDNPAATKTQLPAEWVVRWASEVDRLTAVKLTDHDLDKIELWHAAGLRVLGGDDPILFRYLERRRRRCHRDRPGRAFPRRSGRLGSGQGGGRSCSPSGCSASVSCRSPTCSASATRSRRRRRSSTTSACSTQTKRFAPLFGVTPERRLLLRSAYDLGQMPSASARPSAAATGTLAWRGGTAVSANG